MGTGQIEQQFAISRLRALETSRYVVVAATNGVSGFVAPDGRVVERAPVRTRSVLVHEITLGTALTPAMRWGPVVEGALTLVALLAAVLGALAGSLLGPSRRRRTAPPAATAGRPR